MLLTPIPWAGCVWALPFLTLLAPSERYAQSRGRRHKTLTDWGRQALLQTARWLPDRRIVAVADSSFSVIELLRSVSPHLDVVTRLRLDAGLYEPPPPRRPGDKGRPRVKGARRPKPRQAVAAAPALAPLEVGWYGGGARRVAVLEGTGHWYKAGHGLVPVRWVFVRDTTGTHRDEYFFTTDASLSPTAVIGYYCGRWNVETTFQEARSCLGLETTCGRCEKTVLRAGPCLLGLYTVVAVLFHALPAPKRVGAVSWPGKATVTFSDALCAVRRWLWA